MGNKRSKEKNTRILFRLRLVCGYNNLDYVRIHVIYMVKQMEYAIRIPVAAPQEYVNTYSPRRAVRDCVSPP